MLTCLVAMPFDGFDEVFAAVKAAAGKALPDEPLNCYWLKEIKAAGRITDDILEGIQHSTFCIADLTGQNPNVMWETGFAMALGKPTILITQERQAELPFDLRSHRVLHYEPADLAKLADDLTGSIRETLARYALNTQAERLVRPRSRSQIIAVTGTMNANKSRVQQRLQTVLAPYLDQDVEWYTGSSGVVDELVLDYLVARDKAPLAIGYNRYDFSAEVEKLVQSGKVGFVDASVESLPRNTDGPTERDILFVTKADLIVVFWDGRSHGTKDLIEYFQKNGRNLLIGFI
jgi:nucleoside 2-deoxyribosyltransferase